MFRAFRCAAETAAPDGSTTVPSIEPSSPARTRAGNRSAKIRTETAKASEVHWMRIHPSNRGGNSLDGPKIAFNSRRRYRQSGAADDLREPGVRAQAVQGGVDVKPDQLTSVLLIGLLEEGKCRILFAQAGVDHGWVKG